ncbi:rhythmically expressed gene 2 protein-like [Centruroides vittatus]|uniref:rhythmically expressed gene 2 protein-like n=1 Tax=Centruroides vittatus TaxID=120091 RepID=UPI0035103E69
MSKFKLLTFDVTNTLLKFRMSAGEAYARTAKIYGVHVDAARLNEAFKTQWKLLRKLHPNFGAYEGLTSQQWWQEMVKRTFHDGGCLDASEKQIELITNHLFSDYCTSACWAVYPGTQEILKKFKEMNIKMGVISNFDERLENLLVTMKLRDYFCFVLPSYIIKHEKPSGKIFEIALSHVRSSGVKGKDAVHVGDNFELDYLAAKNAGWNAIWLVQKENDLENLKKVNQNDVIYNIAELKDHILN